MKKISTVLILFLFWLPAVAQQQRKKVPEKKEDILQKIEKVNLLLERYRTMSSAIDDEKKNKSVDSTHNAIVSDLLKILNDKQILQFKLETFIDENGLTISKSPDSKIYLLTIDSKVGSYRANKTIIHYRLPNGEAKANIFTGEASENLGTSTYGKIYLLDSLDREYFVLGRVKTCNTCISSLAVLLKLDTASIKPELVAQYEGRISNLVTMDFSAAVKEFIFEYYAADKDDPLYASDNDKPQFLHRFRSKFKYLYGELIEIERCEYLDRRE